MKELTESVIKELFVKTGVDEKYFSYYETELKRQHKAFREEYPYDENEDEEERAEDEKMEKACIECANDYIRYYVEEREKGHGHKWSDSVARDRVGGEHEFFVYNKVTHVIPSLLHIIHNEFLVKKDSLETFKNYFFADILVND